jgi:uncharacterized protein with von Willebrand factor type A (vWA) domain
MAERPVGRRSRFTPYDGGDPLAPPVDLQDSDGSETVYG